VYKTGPGVSRLLKWANMADLIRISGVGQEYPELFDAADVETVKELRNHNAVWVAAVNASRKLTRTVPTEKPWLAGLIRPTP
jgi:hypothetical protein